MLLLASPERRKRAQEKGREGKGGGCILSRREKRSRRAAMNQADKKRRGVPEREGEPHLWGKEGADLHSGGTISCEEGKNRGGKYTGNRALSSLLLLRGGGKKIGIPAITSRDKSTGVSPSNSEGEGKGIERPSNILFLGGGGERKSLYREYVGRKQKKEGGDQRML